MVDLPLRYYLDEHMPVVIARELRRNGIETVTVRDLGMRGDSDANHLSRANEMGRLLCTMDDDFMKLATNKIEHAGIVIGTRKDRKAIGTWVRFLVWVHRTYTSEEMKNHIEYLRLI